MNSFRKVLGLALVLSVFLSLVACGGGGGGGGGVGDGGAPTGAAGDVNHLMVALPGNPQTLDPQVAIQQDGNRVMRQIYNVLFELTNDLTLRPSLAVGYNWIDNVTFAVELRQGVLFHNGAQMTARDVQFSIERSLASPPTRMLVEMVDSVEIVDDFNVIFHLNTPFADFANHLAHNSSSIVHMDTVLELGDAHAQTPIGTGPFMVTNFVSGDRLELRRFDDYWDQANLPEFEYMTIRVITEPANRLIELETGGVHLAFEVPAEDLGRIVNSNDLSLVRDLNLNTIYVGFNTQKAPFNDVRVRHAISHAISKDQIHQAVFHGSGAPAHGVLNSTVPGNIHDELERFDHNPERAIQLLREAGVEEGFNITIATLDMRVRRDIAEILQHQLSQVGINAEIMVFTVDSFREFVNAGEHDLIIHAWTVGTGNPDYGLYYMFHSSLHMATGNATFYSNPVVDAMLEEARATLDRNQMMAIYADIQRILRDDAPWVPIWQNENLTGISNQITYFSNHPNQNHFLYRARFS